MLKRFKSSVTFLMKLLAFLLCGVCFFGLFGLEYFFLLRPSRTLGVTAVAFIVVYVLMTKVYGGFDIGKRKSKPIVFSMALVLLLTQLINRTKVGMAMRAVAKDFETSQLMGIKINSVISVTFVIGSALAAIGSMLYFTNYPAITPTAGAMPGLKAFVAAVFGGIGSIPGAVIGAFIIGICENLIKSTNFTVFSDAFTFALLIIILVFKPTGLFGEKATDKV